MAGTRWHAIHSIVVPTIAGTRPRVRNLLTIEQHACQRVPTPPQVSLLTCGDALLPTTVSQASLVNAKQERPENRRQRTGRPLDCRVSVCGY